MITLDEDKNYYILVDMQGGTFGGGRILEGEEEVFEQFEDWADADDRDITGYTFGDLIDTWEINIKKYRGTDFDELLGEELDTIKKI